MIFDLEKLREFLTRTEELLTDIRFYASVALLRNQRMADRARRLPGCLLPDAMYRQISTGGGLELATELAMELAGIPGVDALHIYPLGAEVATREVAATFRSARGVPAYRR
jgi:5,10-methylenetetrahydrofolate reductase